MRRLVVLVLLVATLGIVASSELAAEFEVATRFIAGGDWPMWGRTLTRNMVSDATGLPAEWDTDTGLNVKWVAALGSTSYGNPVIADGKIFIGTNNDLMRAPDVAGDKGIVMAFRESDGKFLWQMVHDKLESGQVNDWPFQGICSSPTVDGDRLYYVSNRGEVVALDTEGFLDGENDGSFTDEVRAGEVDGDVVWSFDMIGQLDVFPHNMTSSSPAVYGDLVIVNTSNGRDEEGYLPSPHAPDLIALDKHTGKLVWRAAPLGEQILHGQWSSPAMAEIDGVMQVVIGQGDGWVRGFEVTTGSMLWEFDTNPLDAEYPRTRNNIISTPVIWDNKVFVANGQDPENGEGRGRLHAINATKRGNITESGLVWRVEEIRRSLSTAAIHDGLLYLADFSGFFRCFDVNTGEEVWMYDTFAAVWGSPLVADNKVYLGDEDGDVIVLRAGREMEELAEMNLGNAVYGAPVVANSVLYINTRSQLYALVQQ
ncbi:MAG: PQQ-binding-like beta-propeller repeat protein [Acidobacteria bacterium]|nr:PQQ-binding-like beta-propeller repeat protein [Acidobacteriota bacterium]